jgi:hypothetical protein
LPELAADSDLNSQNDQAEYHGQDYQEPWIIHVYPIYYALPPRANVHVPGPLRHSGHCLRTRPLPDRQSDPRPVLNRCVEHQLSPAEAIAGRRASDRPWCRPSSTASRGAYVTRKLCRQTIDGLLLVKAVAGEGAVGRAATTLPPRR